VLTTLLGKESLYNVKSSLFKLITLMDRIMLTEFYKGLVFRNFLATKNYVEEAHKLKGTEITRFYKGFSFIF
jgi:hypothetical protein